MPSKVERAVEAQLKAVEDAVEALNKAPKIRDPEVNSARRELLSALRPLQREHAKSAKLAKKMAKAKNIADGQLVVFTEAGAEIQDVASRRGDTRNAVAKENKAAAKSEQASRIQSSASKQLEKVQDKIADKQQDLFAFIIARDPIAQMSPNGDIADAVRKTKAGSNFGGLLKQFALDRVKKSSVHAIVLVNLNEAIEAYISSVARACIAKPVETCERLAKADPKERITSIGPDGVDLKNLKQAVIVAYVKINDAQKDKPFRLESRTQKLLEDMGAKLGISDALEKIKTERVEGYSKKNKL